MTDIVERLRGDITEAMLSDQWTTNFKLLDVERKEAADEIERLHELVREAFWEGFQEGKDGGWIGQGHGEPWEKSYARADLEKK
jgi:hypothetical protein